MSVKSTFFLEKNKIASIQALRAYAFLGIFLQHIEIFSLGEWGVSIFLNLSGFIMFYAYRNRDIECGIENNILFSIRKIKKLYLLHIITMLLALIIEMYMHYEYIIPYNIVDIYERVVLNIFLIQSWMPVISICFSLNGVAWYLSICLFLYFMFPYLIKKVKKYNSIFSSVIKIVFVILLQTVVAFILYRLNATEEVTKWVVYIQPIYRLGDFYIGIVCGYIFFKIKNTSGYSDTPLFIFFITVLEVITLALNIIVQYIHDKSIGILGTMYFKFTLLYTPLSIFIVFLFALNKGIISKLLSNKLMIYIGEISGFGFLIHMIITRYYTEFFYKKHSILSYNWLRCAICLLLTILISHMLNNLSIKNNKPKAANSV